jgi:hypothetical protein
VSRVEQVDDWRRGLVGEIARWPKAHPEWTVTAQLPSGFEDRLLATLDARHAEFDPDDPRFRAVFVDALAASVFVPPIDTPGLRADASAAPKPWSMPCQSCWCAPPPATRRWRRFGR